MNDDYVTQTYWNLNSYGKAIRIRRNKLVMLSTSFYTLIALLVPVIVPVPLIYHINKLAKKVFSSDIVWRYG